jgi:hypothetical protein
MTGVRKVYAAREQRPIDRALSYAQLSEKDQAFELLQKVWEFPLGGWEWSPSNPFLDPLRDDPRFEQLLRKLNLPEEAMQRHLTPRF